MAIIATAGDSKTYTPAPEGTHQAVCVDVIDIGLKPNPFKENAMQHKIDIAWQIDERRDDGKRFVLYKRYTLSLNEKATLRHDLESWRGRPFTAEEERGFDVESIIGANCLINVQHKAGKDAGKVFANVVSVMPLIKGMSKIAADGYVRAADQQPEPEPAPEEVTADDIPF
jgi:hypothetical protein